jgi:hypothetical protein
MPQLKLNNKGQIVERRQKFGNKITEVDGIKFRSKGESERYLELKLLQAAGQIQLLKLQVPIPLWANKEQVGTYIADFTYYEGPTYIIEDYKGVQTPLFRLKWSILKSMYRERPEIQLRITERVSSCRRGYPRRNAVSR